MGQPNQWAILQVEASGADESVKTEAKRLLGQLVIQKGFMQSLTVLK